MLNEWCLIESDPAVFTELIERIGVQNIIVEELITTDESELMKFDNVYGLILLFKWHSSREVSTHGTLVKDAPVYFAKQVISNACASMALLNILCNHQEDIQLGEELRHFLVFTQDLDPTLRGTQIGSWERLREAHNSFAQPMLLEKEGASSSRDGEESYHFESFIYRNGGIWELDGMQDGPVLCEEANEANYKATLMEVVRRVMADISAKDTASTGRGISFVLMAVVDDPIPSLESAIENALKEGKETAGLQMELDQRKAEREQNRKENRRRRFNYVPMIVELLMTLAEKGKLEPAINNQKTEKVNRAPKNAKIEK
ncbi:unnamed protein product [Phytomonas sp. Hart1]|nr:unnamed protein product [Phytomonas sp. Hart1]|eukprot:CCW66077.1 unnamed protein product [Phytomonas sp. isolate Hart1]